MNNILVAITMPDPVAFTVGTWPVRWYGLFMACAFLAGYSLIQRRAARRVPGRDTAADLTLAAMLGGVIGARLFYVVQHAAEFRGRPFEVFRIDHGGLVFYGGFIVAAGTVAVLARRRRVALRDVADLMAPALPLGHAFGRVGCLLNGCCFGRVVSSGVGLVYPAASGVLGVQQARGMVPWDAAAPLPVFPVQALSALFNLTLCGLLLWLERRPLRRGQLFGVYLLLYGAGRLAIEFGRGDYPLAGYAPTPAQYLSLLVIIPAGGAIVLAAARAQGAAPQPAPPRRAGPGG